MEFVELSSEDIVDTAALCSAIPKADPRNFQLLALQSIIEEGTAHYVAQYPDNGFNGQLEVLRSVSN